MSLKTNMIRIFSANFLSIISGILLGFIIPAVLSIESYSYVKTYIFYISYVGLLHFGFIDGMYMKYGGKEIKDIDKGELKSEHKVFILMQAIITIVFVLFGVLTKDIIVILIGLSILPINTFAFHSLFYQATGQFKEYTKLSYIYTTVYLIFNILLAVVFRSQNYIYYCLTNLITNGLIYILVEVKFYRNIKGVESKYDFKIWKNIRVGFFVLLGNLSVLLFYAADRWFIKLFLDINDFAYYSFALSMLNIVNSLVGAISVMFYNYLSKGEDEEKIKKIKNYFLLLGGVASLGYFGLDAIVSVFLKKYSQSLSIIAISFSAYPYMIIINALYVNLYKARKNERKYFKVVVRMVGISVIYNTIAVTIWRSSESIAVATTISFITWYIYSMRDFKYLRADLKEIIYLGIIMSTFLFFSHCFNWLIGGVGYLVTIVIMAITFYKKEVLEIINIVLKRD